MTDLQPGERILWEGLPQPGGLLDVSRPGEMVFGLAFIAFSLFWMTKALEQGAFWLFGLPFLVVGMKLAFWRAYQPRLRAKFARYTLTDRRAIVAMHWPLAGVREHALTLTPATIVDSEGEPATIRLHQQMTGPRGAVTESLIFDRIDEGAQVLALIRQVQRGAA